MKNRFILFFALVIISAASLSAFADEKLTADEIINKHLDSIGTKEKRAGVKNQVIVSSLLFSQKGSSTTVNGQSVFASAGEKNLWGMNLASNDYPQEKFSYDGDKTKIAFTKPGVYSILGDFLNSYRGLLKEGLLGGTLFSSWALNTKDSRQAKISASGTKKIDSMETYVLDYSPKSATDLDIRLYFDAKTFRHVRTEYSKFIAARQASSIDNSAGQSSDRIQVIEEFSDFQSMGGLTLPGSYKLTYTYYNNSPIQASKAANREVTWKFKVANFAYNQELDANSFNIETN